MLSISHRISLVFSILVIVLGGLLLYITSEIMHRHSSEQHIHWGHTLASTLSESIAEHIINKEQVKAKQILSRLLQENERLVFIYVVDFDGTISAHTFDKGVPKALFDQYDPELMVQHYTLNDISTLEVWSQLIEGLPARIHLGFDTSVDDKNVQNTLLSLAGLFLISAIIIAIVGSIYGRRIGKPLESLANQLTRFGSNSVESELEADTSFHEINQLVQSFNKMVVERKDYINEILRSQSSLKKAQEIAHIGNWNWDIITGVIDWSDEVYRIFGYEPHEFTPTFERFINSIHVADRDKVTTAVDASLKDPELEYKLEHRVVRPDGDIHWVMEKGEITYKDNKPRFMTGIVYDITETKKADLVVRAYQEELEIKVKERTMELSSANQQLQQLDHLKSMFIATMSHELRTPLNSIIGFTSVILKGMTGELNEKQKDQLGRVLTSAKHLLSLISDIIDISKIEAGRVDVVPEDINFNTLISEIDAQVRGLFSEKNIEFKIDISDKLELSSDRIRLTQVLINILSNAAKYTESGQVTLTAKQIDHSIEVYVSDTGVGISDEDLDRLFEPFERIDNRLSVKSGGTGLGLYLTKKLLDDVLKGDISVHSKPNQGSCFTIVLPLSLNIDTIAPKNEMGRASA